MKKLLEKNETLMQIVNDARHPSTCPKGQMDPPDKFHQSISQIFFEKSN